jgi:hypothetical protein
MANITDPPTVRNFVTNICRPHEVILEYNMVAGLAQGISHGGTYAHGRLVALIAAFASSRPV